MQSYLYYVKQKDYPQLNGSRQTRHIETLAQH